MLRNKKQPADLCMQTGLILVLLHIFSTYSFSQESSVDHSVFTFFDSQYGLNPDIYRGRKYINLERYQSGNPFFNNVDNISIKFSEGKILFEEKRIEDVQLLYDVYKQEVIIQSESLFGVNNEIVMLNALIDEFWLGEYHFVKNPFEEIDALFIEKIEGNNTEVVCFLSYYKEYRIQQNSGRGVMGFGELRSRKYLFVDQRILGFKGKKSFLNGLSSQDKEKALSFIKSNPVKFKNANSRYFDDLLKTLSLKTAGDV